MSALSTSSLEQVGHRLREKSLFGAPADSTSLRGPDEDGVSFRRAGENASDLFEEAEATKDAALHVAVYRARPDVGAILVGTTPWMKALSAMGVRLPSLFDEQARHIGPVPAPLAEGEYERLVAELGSGANAALVGSTRVCLGSTPSRVVLNADLFEKCAKAFVLAASTGLPVRPLPAWASELWYARLRNAQTRAATAYRAGRLPEGMDSY